MALTLASAEFKNGATIPSKYTCDGSRFLSPPLTISGVPEGSKSLVLIMDDADVPRLLRPEGVFDHWVLFNIPADTTTIAEDAVVGTLGSNTRGEARYTGPCPPPEYEPREHRYIFKLYALNAQLALPAGATKREVLDALAPVVIEEAELVGRYART